MAFFLVSFFSRDALVVEKLFRGLRAVRSLACSLHGEAFTISISHSHRGMVSLGLIQFHLIKGGPFCAVLLCFFFVRELLGWGWKTCWNVVGGERR